MKKNMVKFSAILLSFMVIFTSCAKPSVDVPNGMKEISNENVDYHLYVPTNWTEDMSTGIISAYYNTKDRTNISVTTFNLSKSDMTLDDYWKTYQESFSLTFPDMEMVDTSNIILGGIPANKYVYTASVTGEKYKYMQIIAINRGLSYVFTYTASPESYDLHIEEAQNMIDNFKFK